MAGGKVGGGRIYGLFKIVKNDDQLAAVIGHEIAHVTAKHIHEKLSQELASKHGRHRGNDLAPASVAHRFFTVDALSSAYGLTTSVGGFAFEPERKRRPTTSG